MSACCECHDPSPRTLVNYTRPDEIAWPHPNGKSQAGVATNLYPADGAYCPACWGALVLYVRGLVAEAQGRTLPRMASTLKDRAFQRVAPRKYGKRAA